MFHIYLHHFSYCLDIVKNRLYDEQGASGRFTKLSNILVNQFPPKKVEHLKFSLISKCDLFFIYVTILWYIFPLTIILYLNVSGGWVVKKLSIRPGFKFWKSFFGHKLLSSLEKIPIIQITFLFSSYTGTLMQRR